MTMICGLSSLYHSGKFCMNPPGSFAELQRCNGCKGAVGCAVVVPILLSLPIALVIAWAFEMTPDGTKRMRDVFA